MSLKYFHITFICISTLFSILFGYWSYIEWAQFGDKIYFTYALVAVFFTISLLAYGKWFLKEIVEINEA